MPACDGGNQLKYRNLLAFATASIIGRPPDGLFAQDIVLGQSAALTGPAQELGKEMQLGAKGTLMPSTRRAASVARKLS